MYSFRLVRDARRVALRGCSTPYRTFTSRHRDNIGGIFGFQEQSFEMDERSNPFQPQHDEDDMWLKNLSEAERAELEKARDLAIKEAEIAEALESNRKDGSAALQAVHADGKQASEDVLDIGMNNPLEKRDRRRDVTQKKSRKGMVIFSNEHYAVLNKPTDYAFDHPSLLQQMPPSKFDPDFRPFCITPQDFAVGGLTLYARTQEAKDFLLEMRQQKRFRLGYDAVVMGQMDPGDNAGRCVAPLEYRKSNGPNRSAVADEFKDYVPSGKVGTELVKPVARLDLVGLGAREYMAKKGNAVPSSTTWFNVGGVHASATVLRLIPHTLRRHQLYVHTAMELGMPILGDYEIGPGVTGELAPLFEKGYIDTGPETYDGADGEEIGLQVDEDGYVISGDHRERELVNELARNVESSQYAGTRTPVPSPVPAESGPTKTVRLHLFCRTIALDGMDSIKNDEKLRQMCMKMLPRSGGKGGLLYHTKLPRFFKKTLLQLGLPYPAPDPRNYSPKLSAVRRMSKSRPRRRK
eukprot:Clim_evm8s109 gene=Clim_evmTU8s109